MERLRLTWRESRAGGWYAMAGHLRLWADGNEHAGWWDITCQGLDVHRGPRSSGDADTLIAAQLAAEAAALELLTDAVGAFGVEDDRLHADPSLGLCVEATGLEHGPDATRLACALLAAARKP